MAKKKETKEVPPDSPLVTAAKTIGVAAGKIATTVGVVTPTQPKVPKLAKKLKNRLPRRQKKAARRAGKSI